MPRSTYDYLSFLHSSFCRFCLLHNNNVFQIWQARKKETKEMLARNYVVKIHFAIKWTIREIYHLYVCAAFEDWEAQRAAILWIDCGCDESGGEALSIYRFYLSVVVSISCPIFLYRYRLSVAFFQVSCQSSSKVCHSEEWSAVWAKGKSFSVSNRKPKIRKVIGQQIGMVRQIVLNSVIVRT